MVNVDYKSVESNSSKQKSARSSTEVARDLYTKKLFKNLPSEKAQEIVLKTGALVSEETITEVRSVVEDHIKRRKMMKSSSVPTLHKEPPISLKRLRDTEAALAEN